METFKSIFASKCIFFLTFPLIQAGKCGAKPTTQMEFVAESDELNKGGEQRKVDLVDPIEHGERHYT